MHADWQTWAAPAVVIATILIFLGRAARQKRRGGCGTCGTGGAPKRK